jgi:predicted dehydrogenase
MSMDIEPAWRIEPGAGRHLGIGIIGTSVATLAGTIGLTHDDPNGRPDTLSLHRHGKQIRQDHFEMRWIPDAFPGPMSDLTDAIETGRSPVTAGRDNLGTTAVAQAAYRSAEERRSVRLDEISGAT